MSKKPVTRDVIEQVRREGGNWLERLVIEASKRHDTPIVAKAERDRESRRRSAAEARSAKPSTSERNRKLAELAEENNWTAAQLRYRLQVRTELREATLGEGAQREDVLSRRQLQRILAEKKRVT